MQERKFKWISILATVVIVVGLLAFALSGENAKIVKTLFEGNLEEGEFAELVQSLGTRGAITLTILSMLQVVMAFLPAEPVQVLSGISYGLGWGMLICIIGVFLGNTLIYLCYKLFGNKITKYFKSNIDIDFDKIRSSKRIAFIVFILYFLPAIPYGLICLFYASMKTKYPRYIILTTLCSIPSIFLGVGMGEMVMSASWILTLVIFCVIVILIALLYFYRKAVFATINRFIYKHQHIAGGKLAFPVQKHSRFALFIARVVMRFHFSRVKYKLNVKDKVQGPCMVLCNHGSFYDFCYCGKALIKYKPNIVAARLYFYHKKLATLMRRLGAFPKSMFVTDLENVKNCMSVLKKGGTLMMMPEARLSTVGKFEDIQESTIKFIHKMKVAVYVINVNGSYFSKPKWGDKVRKGAHVEATLSKLYSAEEVESMQFDKLKEGVIANLQYNDFHWLESHPDYVYKSKTLAKGLENILFRCPHCKKELTIQTDKREVFCTECGLKTSINDRYAFVDGPFNNFADWYDWQCECLKKEIIGNPDYALTEKVVLCHSSLDGKHLVREAGEGVCTLNREGLTYKGTDDGEQVDVFFSMDGIYRLLFGAGEDFEIYQEKEIYYFRPEDRRSCVKWYVASAILKDLSEGKIK